MGGLHHPPEPEDSALRQTQVPCHQVSWIESPESRTERRRDVLKELQLQSWTRADSSTQTQHRSSWKHTRTTKPVTVTAFKWIQRAPGGGIRSSPSVPNRT